MAAYGEAVAQSGGLGRGSIINRSCEGATGDVGSRLDGVDGSLSAEASL